MNELIINKKDAYAIWGVHMEDDFLNSIFSPSPLKEFVENKSRLEHGKQVLISNPRLDEREITLTFALEGSSQSDFRDKYRAFQEELAKGCIEIKIPALGEEVYHLIYQRSTSFAMNVSRTFSKISVKFSEPNPANRN